jgi:Domain of unknown function (DUF5666)
MRQLMVGVVAGIFLLGAGVATATAQPTKSVSGTVTAVGPDSVTVKVKDQDMKFVVDKTTEVLTRGGTTATRAAKAEGKSGPAIGAVVKPGQSVEVKYHEAGMHAATIRVLSSAAPPPPATTAQQEKPAADKPKSGSASGTVASMTGTSLTVKTSSGEQTFNVNSKTKIIGTGLSTKANEAAAAGKKQVLSDTVGVGDTVSVSYHEVGGAKEASEVRVRQKAAKK